MWKPHGGRRTLPPPDLVSARLDRSHPLAAKLAVAVLFGQGSAVNLLDGEPAAVTLNSGTPRPNVKGRLGRTARFEANGNRYTLANPDNQAWALPVSFATALQTDIASQTNTYYSVFSIGVSDAFTLTNGFMFWFKNDAAVQRWYMQYGTGANDWGVIVRDMPNAAPQSIVGTVRNGAQTFYADGVSLGGETDSGIGFVSPTTGVRVGNCDDVFGANSTAMDMAYLYLWNGRELTEAEAKSIHDNPYQILIPQRRTLWMPGATAGGGGTTISVPAGALAVTGTSGQLLATMPVAAAAVSVTGQMPQVTLQMPVAAADLALTGGAPALGWTVPVSPAALVLTGETPSLGGVVSLNVGAGTLALNGAAPSLQISMPVSAGALAMAGSESALQLQMPIAAGSLAASGQATALCLDMPVATAALAWSAPAPSMALDMAVAAGQLLLTPQTPALEWRTAPATGTLAANGQTPSLGLSLVPVTGVLSLEGVTPSVILPQFASVGAGALTLAGLTPTLDLGALLPNNIIVATLSAATTERTQIVAFSRSLTVTEVTQSVRFDG